MKVTFSWRVIAGITGTTAIAVGCLAGCGSSSPAVTVTVTPGAYATEGQHGSGPAAEAPLVRRGKELRSELLLRVFSVERFLRFLVLSAAAYGVWRFRYDKAGVQRAFNDAMPAIRDLYRGLGFDITHSKLLGFIQHSFTLSPRALLYRKYSEVP